MINIERITERITQIESELQQCQQQVQFWTQAQLRAEGALLILRQLKEENEKDNATTSPVPGAGPSGSSGLSEYRSLNFPSRQ